MIQTALVVMETVAQQKGLDLAAVVDPNVPARLVSDANRIRQVVLNLLSNAVKFTEAGGVLLRARSRTWHGRVMLHIEIADAGPGIPESDRNKLFMEFSQLQGNAARRYRGTGLGLAICRRLIAALGGHLRYASELGVGTRFWFIIPVAVAEGPPPHVSLAAGQTVRVYGGGSRVRAGLSLLLAQEGFAVLEGAGTEAEIVLRHVGAPAAHVNQSARLIPFGPGTRLESPITADRLRAALSETPAADKVPQTSRPSPPPPALAKPARALHVLLAEDDPINREIAEGLLRLLGHRVTSVGDGRSALDAIRTGRFDLVMLDMQMPLMNGIEVTRAIRALPGPTGRVPIIAVTADAATHIRDTGLAAGLDSFVAKPLTLARLAETLAEVLPPEIRARPPEPVAMAPAGGPGTVDPVQRGLLTASLTPERLRALIESFWEGVAALSEICGADRTEADEGALRRRLHSLQGSSASLGYPMVARAVRSAREALHDGGTTSGVMLVLRAPLAEALRADMGLLPPALVQSLWTRLSAPEDAEAGAAASAGVN
jgi:CheY-like chemotaxis protein